MPLTAAPLPLGRGYARGPRAVQPLTFIDLPVNGAGAARHG
jgi:hypothetical protein